MTDVQLYGALKDAKRGTLSRLAEKSELSKASIRRILYTGEQKNLKVRELAIELLEKAIQDTKNKEAKERELNRRAQKLTPSV